MTLSVETKNWIIGATGFSKVANAYLTVEAKDPFFSFPTFYFNLCYLYELSLKGYLSHNGWSDKRLRLDLAHDLEKGWQAAIGEGYVPPSDEVKMLMKVLAPHHKQHTFRYLRNDWMVIPDNHFESMRTAHSHLLAIGHQLGLPETVT